MKEFKDTKNFIDMEVGDDITRPLLVGTIVENRAKNGKPYVCIKLKDGQSEIEGKMFDMGKAELQERGITVDAVADIRLIVQDFNGNKSYNIRTIEPAADKTLTFRDFIKTPPVPIEDLWEEIISFVKVTENDMNGTVTPLTTLTLKLLERHKDAFMSSSAAKAVHHNCFGGLVWHTAEVVKAAAALADVFPDIDMELVTCGAALHDLGKIWGYDTTPAGEASLSPEGILFEHAFLGAEAVRAAAEGAGCDKERVRMLMHIILAHHGKQEFGAVVAPATREAVVVHLADDASAKLEVYRTAMETLEPGTVTDKRPFGIDNSVYMPKYMA